MMRTSLIIMSFLISNFCLAQKIQSNNPDHDHDDHQVCGLTADMTKALWQSLQSVRSKYTDHKNLKSAPLPSFSWPLRPSGNVYAPGYYYLSNNVDLDPTTGILDYRGLSRSYDGHGGIDISPYPYFWTMMDNNEVEVVAAAEGTIINKADGNFDKNCTWSGQDGNGIVLLHDCGISTIYWHFKNGTITSKEVGDVVERGEFLGYVGSSGVSTNPHLHFEVKDVFGNSLDPYEGPFNNTIQSSLWANQKPYYESSLLKLMTHSVVTSLNNCPTNPTDTPNIRNHFGQLGFIRFGSYFMAPRAGHSAECYVYNPYGVLVWDWTIDFDTDVSRRTQQFQNFILPANADVGTWTFRVEYGDVNQTAEHHFTVGCETALTLGGFHLDGQGYIYSDWIHSTAEVGAEDQRVLYEAGNHVELRPGFVAEAGCSFRTRLDDCSQNGN